MADQASPADPTPPPPPPTLEGELRRIRATLPDGVLGMEEGPDEGHFVVDIRARHLHSIVRALRDDRALAYVMLTDLFGVDRPERPDRLQVYYQLYSPTRDRRVHLRVSVRPEESVPTLSDVFPGADWPEREASELLGVIFAGHPDPRPLLLPDDFEGHPLRKDFPLVGRRPVLLFNHVKDLL